MSDRQFTITSKEEALQRGRDIKYNRMDRLVQVIEQKIEEWADEDGGRGEGDIQIDLYEPPEKRAAIDVGRLYKEAGWEVEIDQQEFTAMWLR